MAISSNVPGIKNALEINTALKVITTQVNADTAAIALKAPATSPTFATDATFSFATASTTPVFDGSKKLVSSSVTATELAMIHGQTGTVKAGAYTVVADDDTANAATVVTGLTSIVAPMVQILRAGAVVTGDAVVTVTGGSIGVADGGATYTVTTGDVINWIAVGAV